MGPESYGCPEPPNFSISSCQHLYGQEGCQTYTLPILELPLFSKILIFNHDTLVGPKLIENYLCKVTTWSN